MSDQGRQQEDRPDYETLRQFACAVLGGYDDGVVGDIDGGWLQDFALSLGLLAPCGEEDPNYVIAPGLAAAPSYAEGKGGSYVQTMSQVHPKGGDCSEPESASATGEHAGEVNAGVTHPAYNTLVGSGADVIARIDGFAEHWEEKAENARFAASLRGKSDDEPEMPYVRLFVDEIDAFVAEIRKLLPAPPVGPAERTRDEP